MYVVRVYTMLHSYYGMGWWYATIFKCSIGTSTTFVFIFSHFTWAMQVQVWGSIESILSGEPKYNIDAAVGNVGFETLKDWRG